MTLPLGTQAFCDYVNQHLPAQVDTSVCRSMFEDEEAFETVLRSYQAAREPQHFSNRIITRNDIYLDQAYGLLEVTFTPDVLRPRNDYRRAYSKPQEPRLSVTMMRCWHVPGAHQYDSMGQLVHFNPDPLSVTSGVAAVISGSCMNLVDVGRPSDCIGSIAYLAVRPSLRRKGHGRLLLEAFENELQAIAQAQGWQMRLIVLEAEARATDFWSSCNYRWPEHSQYMQPSIEFDTQSGQPLFSAVPETLMLRVLDSSPNDCIDQALLLDVVRTIYTRWYVPKSGPPEAIARAQANIEDLFNQFRQSLPEGKTIPLVKP